MKKTYKYREQCICKRCRERRERERQTEIIRYFRGKSGAVTRVAPQGEVQ